VPAVRSYFSKKVRISANADITGVTMFDGESASR
jgi:hypothetical protein